MAVAGESAGGGGGGPGRGPTEGEEELATRMLQIQSKRFYLDVKQNWRGRFLKIAEVGPGSFFGKSKTKLLARSALAGGKAACSCPWRRPPSSATTSWSSVTSTPASVGPISNGFKVLKTSLLGPGPPNPAITPEDGQLKCAVIVKENRRYYLDLKENNRGRFLRVRLHHIRLSPAQRTPSKGGGLSILPPQPLAPPLSQPLGGGQPRSTSVWGRGRG